MGDIPVEYGDCWFDADPGFPVKHRTGRHWMFVPGAFARSSVEQRAELNLAHDNLIKTNPSQAKPVQLQTQRGLWSCQSYHRVGILWKILPTPAAGGSRQLLCSVSVSSAGLGMPEDFI